MKRKPWSIIILALLHILAPVGNLLLNAYRIDANPLVLWNDWLHFFPKPLLFTNIVLPPLAGIFIYICKKWSYWAYIACLVAIFSVSMVNLFTVHADISIPNILFRLLTLFINILVVAYIVIPSIRKIYLDPRIRWWEAAPRYIFHNEAQINGSAGFIKNISQGGLFLSSECPFEESDQVQLKWSAKGVHFELPAKIVYKSENFSSEGFGIQFTHTNESYKLIKKLIAQLHADGQLVPERISGPEESFLAWLKKLLKNGEGLFPKS